MRNRSYGDYINRKSCESWRGRGPGPEPPPPQTSCQDGTDRTVFEALFLHRRVWL